LGSSLMVTSIFIGVVGVDLTGAGRVSPLGTL
jgi:hypothetical protein